MVIIGLLLGGALKGQQMIESARIKSLVRFVDEFKAGYYFYQDTYRYLPGDDPEADRFDEVSSAQVGDGDGLLEGNWRVNGDESVEVWRHMIAAGLLGIGMPDASSSTWGGGARIPENDFGGVVGFEYNVGELGVPVLCFNNISAEVAVKIDLAADDGDIYSGAVFATDMIVANKLTSSTSYNYRSHALCFEF